MHALLSINTLDPFLGQIDYASLSDQACMEILSADLTLDQKRAFMILHSDTHDAYDYKDVCKWGCSECDEEGRVVQLTLFDYVGIPAASDQAYRLNLAYIPAELKTFIIAQLKCESACNISDLPGISKDSMFAELPCAAYLKFPISQEVSFCAISASIDFKVAVIYRRFLV